MAEFMNSKGENTNSNCVLCTLLTRERTVAETELSYVVVTNPSMTPGHVMVVPKRHVWKPWEVTEDELLDIFRLINTYRQKVEQAYDCGTDIRQHHRPFIPEGAVHNLRHVHYHILPRSLNDAISDAEQNLSERLTEEQVSQALEKLQ